MSKNPFDPFLQAILAAPDDDVPRLIAADWLDENGESDRAEFVRLQVKANQESARPLKERLAFTKSAHDILCRRSPWYGRLGRLVTRPNRAAWSRPAPASWDVGFRRGFAEAIRCPLIEWLRGGKGAAVLSALPLREVRCSSNLPGARSSFDVLLTLAKDADGWRARAEVFSGETLHQPDHVSATYKGRKQAAAGSAAVIGQALLRTGCGTAWAVGAGVRLEELIHG